MNKSTVWQTFDAIAPQYDKINRILSLGIDILWRKKVCSHLPVGNELKVLDLATGTGDLLGEIGKLPRVAEVTGIDMAKEMLAIAEEKYGTAPTQAKLSFIHADASSLPFESESFDAASMAFGIRNIADPLQCLHEIFRVLKPKGRAIILEFSLPESWLIRRIYLFYFRHILPKIGGILSGNNKAYKYLNTSVESFPYGDDFLALMTTCGFSKVQAHPLTFGIATIYVGDRAK